jgi:hypothetical protein
MYEMKKFQSLKIMEKKDKVEEITSFLIKEIIL